MRKKKTVEQVLIDVMRFKETFPDSPGYSEFQAHQAAEELEVPLWALKIALDMVEDNSFQEAIAYIRGVQVTLIEVRKLLSEIYFEK